MKGNPVRELGKLGQSIWIDYIRRDLITSGRLGRFIQDDGLRGMTSNPAIFEKAIAGSTEYDEEIRDLARRGNDVMTILEELTLHDVRSAADEFRQVYEVTGGQDGYVSLEINPHLAHDARASIDEGRRLWAALDRPNVFIKIPATLEGLPVIRQLITEGINVNVTLLFDVPRYRSVAAAYIEGLEARVAAGRDLDSIASVASFFVSRIDSLVDQRLKEIVARNETEAVTARSLLGQVAIDNARSAYLTYKATFSEERFKRLEAKGARTQRVLWASTSTKDPAYSDIKYVEALIGPETVNTMPIETIDAYRDHGHPAARLNGNHSDIGRALRRLAEVGIDMERIARQLEDEGVEKFNKPFDSLLDTLAQKVATAGIGVR